jgi:hypothetical protein
MQPDEARRMYLVGARFGSTEAATAALQELRSRTRVESGDLGLRPLGSLRYEEPTRGLVVAGRFGPTEVELVIEIMEHHGGEIVFKRAEWRTPRPQSRGSDRSCSRCQRLTNLRR